MDYKQYYDCVIGPHYQEDTNAMYKIMYVVFGNYKNKLWILEVYNRRVSIEVLRILNFGNNSAWIMSITIWILSHRGVYECGRTWNYLLNFKAINQIYVIQSLHFEQVAILQESIVT